jgi:hypothetical protein
VIGLAIGLAVAVGVSASPAQGPAETGANPRVTVAEPTGKVAVGHDLVKGEPVYVRRTTGTEGVTIVEVSTTPFVPVVRSAAAPSAVSAPISTPTSQPASW